MGVRVVRFEQTPNPNAIKCVLDRALAPAPRSFFGPGEGRDDPVAGPLFAIEGVTNVLVCADWVTVSREPGRAWGPLRREIERAMGALEANPS